MWCDVRENCVVQCRESVSRTFDLFLATGNGNGNRNRKKGRMGEIGNKAKRDVCQYQTDDSFWMFGTFFFSVGWGIRDEGWGMRDDKWWATRVVYLVLCTYDDGVFFFSLSPFVLVLSNQTNTVQGGSVGWPDWLADWSMQQQVMGIWGQDNNQSLSHQVDITSWGVTMVSRRVGMREGGGWLSGRLRLA